VLLGGRVSTLPLMEHTVPTKEKTMAYLNFKINNNGDTKNTFKSNAKDLGAAVRDLEQALRTAYPYGRNYQTCDGPAEAQRSDEDRFQEAFRALKKIDDLYNNYVTTIADQL
jgi:hypothetical protein